MDFPAVVKFLLDIGVVGILGVLLLYLFRTYIPGLQADFRVALRECNDRMDRQEEKFQEILSNKTRMFLDALTQERQEFAIAMKEAVSSNVSLERAIDRLAGANNALTMAIMKDK